MSKPEKIIVGLEASVIGLDAQTGEVCWHNDMSLGGHSWVALAVHEEVVFASANAKRIFCIEKETGQTLWSAPTNGIGRAALMVTDQGICVSKGGFVECFSFEGSLLWSKNLKQWGKKAAAMAYKNTIVQADG